MAINVDASGVVTKSEDIAAHGGSVAQNLPKGAYPVKVKKVTAETNSKGTYYKFIVEVADGQFYGTVRNVLVNSDKLALRTALLSAGFTSAEIDAGPIDLETAIDRGAFMAVTGLGKPTEKNGATVQYDETRFVTPDHAASLIKNATAELASSLKS